MLTGRCWACGSPQTESAKFWLQRGATNLICETARHRNQVSIPINLKKSETHYGRSGYRTASHAGRVATRSQNPGKRCESNQPRLELPREVKIQASVASRINLADFQNAVPAIHELAIVNETGQPFRNLRLTAISAPPFLKPKTWHIDQLAPGQALRIADLNIALDGALLGRLTESEKAILNLELTGEDGAPIAGSESTVELLPRNQWGGLSSLPDMVAAFVQPNEPAVERVLKSAADVLRKAGKSGSINGYQEGAKRAR